MENICKSKIKTDQHSSEGCTGNATTFRKHNLVEGSKRKAIKKFSLCPGEKVFATIIMQITSQWEPLVFIDDSITDILFAVQAAVLIAYCGENYHGMAMNRGNRQFKTIEGELVSALVKAKLVPENCWEDPSKMTYKIASRTDKGVSTCGQVASLKLIMNENVVALLNEQLPSDIRVLAVSRTTKGFSAQQCAGSRTYSYTLPTFAFASPSEVSKDYRISKEKLVHVQSILDKYKGTHSYHNFTSGKRMGEMSAQRYIIEFYFESPFLQGSMELMTFKLKGQSFMIHQIRKMVGLLIVLVSGYAKEDYFQQAFNEPLVDIPKAPGTGLVLEKVHYDGYNKKHGHLHGGIDFSDVEDKVEEFRKTRILPSIYRKEEEESSMMEWLKTLPFHDYTGKRAKEDWEKQNALRKATHEKSNIVNETVKELNLSTKPEDNLPVKRTKNSTEVNEEFSEPVTKKEKIEQIDVSTES